MTTPLLEWIDPRDRKAAHPCLPVLRQLRPHLGEDAAVLDQLARQAAEGYRLLAARLEPEGPVVALAGWRLTENTVYGRYLYVDDLVTEPALRGARLGDHLIDTLIDLAKREGCRRFTLDSGVTNADAHRFYFRKRLTIGAYRFGLALG